MSIMLSTADLSRLHRLSSMLLSPLDDDSIDAWRRNVCLEFRGLFGGDKVYFLGEGLPGVDVLWSDGFPEPLAQAYRDIYRVDEGTTRALRRGYTAFNQTVIVAGDWDGYHRDPMVNEVYLPNGVRDACGLIAEAECRVDGRQIGRRFQLGGGHDTYGTEQFGEKGLALLHLLAPSFQAAVGTLVATAQWRRDLTAALDAVDAAAWVFSGDGRLTLHRNGAAASLMDDDPDGSLIEARAGTMAKEMARAAHPSKSTPVEGEGEVDTMIDLRTRFGRYTVRGTHAGPSRIGMGSTILVVVSRVSPRPVAWPALRRTYALTARETDVARLICAGKSNSEIARELDISPHTARRHTEQLYAKLEVHSRGEAQRVIRES